MTSKISQEEMSAVSAEEIIEYRNRQYNKRFQKSVFNMFICAADAEYNASDECIRYSIVYEKQVAKIMATNLLHVTKQYRDKISGKEQI